MKLVAFVETMHILKGLTEGCRHLLIKILMMSFVFAQSICNKLICASLLDVVVEPGKIKFIHTETD